MDTDHIWGHGIKYTWVWKSFLRGHNVLFMDPTIPLPDWFNPDLNRPDHPDYEPARKALGHTCSYATRMNLAAMTPHDQLASTQFYLANPGKEYLVYLPEGGEVMVDLSAASGQLKVEWMDPVEGTITRVGPTTGGAKRTLKAPFRGDAVLYIWKPTPGK